MNEKIVEQFLKENDLLKDALNVYVVGSRAYGYFKPTSDHDLKIVVSDEYRFESDLKNLKS